jgi:hypothetical protein
LSRKPLRLKKGQYLKIPRAPLTHVLGTKLAPIDNTAKSSSLQNRVDRPTGTVEDMIRIAAAREA